MISQPRAGSRSRIAAIVVARCHSVLQIGKGGRRSGLATVVRVAPEPNVAPNECWSIDHLHPEWLRELAPDIDAMSEHQVVCPAEERQSSITLRSNTISVMSGSSAAAPF